MVYSSNFHMVSLLCRLILFPKLQVFTYSLLMVPVVYGASKLIASSSADHDNSSVAAGVACVVLLPLPVLGFWAYILYSLRANPNTGDKSSKPPKRSIGCLLNTYKRPTLDDSSMLHGETTARQAADAGQQRLAATLALLGDVGDNPTLVIQDKKEEEQELESSFDSDRTISDSESEDNAHDNSHSAQSSALQKQRDWVVGRPRHEATGYTRPWRSLQSPMSSGAGEVGL